MEWRPWTGASRKSRSNLTRWCLQEEGERTHGRCMVNLEAEKPRSKDPSSVIRQGIMAGISIARGTESIYECIIQARSNTITCKMCYFIPHYCVVEFETVNIYGIITITSHLLSCLFVLFYYLLFIMNQKQHNGRE